MTDQIPPEVLAHLEVAALNMPHQLFVADRILKLEIGAFVSILTLGNSTPAAQVIPVATINISTEKLRALAEAILSNIDANSAFIKEELAAFSAKLP